MWIHGGVLSGLLSGRICCVWMGGGRLALGLLLDYVYISEGFGLGIWRREKIKILAVFIEK